MQKITKIIPSDINIPLLDYFLPDQILWPKLRTENRIETEMIHIQNLNSLIILINLLQRTWGNVPTVEHEGHRTTPKETEGRDGGHQEQRDGQQSVKSSDPLPG